MRIPKIIHQTYKHHQLPDIYKHCQSILLDLHSDYEYRFYTDEDINQEIKTHFPTYYEAFHALPRMIMKIDMFRYFLMYQYGGLYVDMDYLMFKRFDLLDYTVVLPCNRENSDIKPICLGNCIFASIPKHPFWKLLMDSLLTMNRSIDYSIDEHISEHKLGTGPMFVFHKWKKYKKKHKDILIPKRKVFHPPSKQNQDYMQQLKESGCYGMHICTGSWTNHKL